MTKKNARKQRRKRKKTRKRKGLHGESMVEPTLTGARPMAQTVAVTAEEANNVFGRKKNEIYCQNNSVCAIYPVIEQFFCTSYDYYSALMHDLYENE